MTSPGNQFLRSTYDMGAGYASSGAPGRRPPSDTDGASAHALALLVRPDWHAQAACKGKLHLFFPPFDTSKSDLANYAKRAQAICATCPVQAPCYEAGRDENHGIWGGAGTRARRAARAKEPATIYRALTAEQVVAVREQWRAGKSLNALADYYGCRKATIRAALVGRTHPDVPDPVSDRELLERRRWNRGKLTPDEVRKIRRLAADGVAPAEIARRFDITKRNAHAIINRDTWQHITDQGEEAS